MVLLNARGRPLLVASGQAGSRYCSASLVLIAPGPSCRRWASMSTWKRCLGSLRSLGCEKQVETATGSSAMPFHDLAWWHLWFLPLVVPLFFLWVVVHEVSHWALAKLLIGIESVRFKFYPNRGSSGKLRAASVRFKLSRPARPWERAVYSLAPRGPDLIACVALPFGWILGSPWAVIWSLAWGAGLVDLWTGSVGIGERSDLRHAADAVGWNYWSLRVPGFLCIAVSFGLWIWMGVR